MEIHSAFAPNNTLHFFDKLRTLNGEIYDPGPRLNMTHLIIYALLGSALLIKSALPYLPFLLIKFYNAHVWKDIRSGWVLKSARNNAENLCKNYFRGNEANSKGGKRK